MKRSTMGKITVCAFGCGALFSILLVAQDVSQPAPEQEVTAVPHPDAQIVAKPAVLLPNAGQNPWLGFDVTRADDIVRAQLPKLPKGIGFVVASVEPAGPAALGGIQELDVVWKMNEQLLVNEAQFAVLLQLQKVGDKVEFTIFRAGEEKKLQVLLDVSPQGRAVVAGPTIDSIKNPTQIPLLETVRPLDANTCTARLEDRTAVLEMENRAEGIWLTITNEEGNEVFADFLNATTEKKIPEVWHNRVEDLKVILHGRMKRECQNREQEK